jgi:poly(A) polymerase
LEDVERKRIFTIGDPHVRFREDPIRILRALTYAARLDIGIDPDVCDAMVAWRDELGRAARPRVFEEILRLLRGGAAHRSMWLFWEFGSMAVLLPELAALLDDEGSNEAGVKRFWRRLDAIDVMTRERGAPLDDVVLWTVLLLEPLAEMAQGEPDIAKATYEFLEGLIVRISMPRRIADLVRRIFAMLPRLVSGKLARATRGEALHYAFDVLEVDTRARGRSIEGIRGLRVSVGLPADGGAPVDEEFRRRPSRRPMRRGPR